MEQQKVAPEDAMLDELIDRLHRRNRIDTIEDARRLSVLDEWSNQGGSVADPDSIVTAGELFADDPDNGTAVTAIGIVAAAGIVVLLSFFAGFIARGML